MAEVEVRDTKSLVKDFDEHEGAPPQYEQYEPDPPTWGHPQPTYPAPVQQNTVVVSQPSAVTVAPQDPMPDSAGAIILSCCVFWCCCWPLGLAAFIVAMMASSATNVTDARGHVRTSYILSVVGLVFGAIILVIVVIAVIAGSASETSVENSDYYN